MGYLDSMPLVSVIIPIYNVEKYLKRCLDSVVGQTYHNLEIILVNDGSTDGSREICQRYAQNDSRIRLFTQENQGLSAARNTGLDHMNGEYIVFVDSDDYISTYFVEIMLNKLLEYDVKIAMCAYLEVNDADNDANIDCFSLEDIGSCIKIRRDDMFDKPKRITVWGGIYYKGIFESLRFEPGRIHEDLFIFHKIYMQVEDICWIDHTLYAYRQSTNSITRINGIGQFHPDIIDAQMEQLSFFQKYGNAKIIRTAKKEIFRTLPELINSMEVPELIGLIARTEQEMYRITGRKTFSLRLMLFKVSPEFYVRISKNYDRIIKAVKFMLLKGSPKFYLWVKKLYGH